MIIPVLDYCAEVYRIALCRPVESGDLQSHILFAAGGQYGIGTGMTRSKRSGRLERVRTRSHRKAKLILLALGTTGAVLGLSFLGFAFWSDNSKLLPWGLVYVLGATGLLAGRQALVALGEAQRQNREGRRGERVRRRRDPAPDPAQDSAREPARIPAGESRLP